MPPDPDPGVDPTADGASDGSGSPTAGGAREGSGTPTADGPPGEGSVGDGPPGEGSARSTDGSARSGERERAGLPTEGAALDAGELPDFVAARDHVRDELVRFARALRRAGASVPANAATEAARALVVTGFEEEPARAALRASLVTREEDLAVFERAFPEFWRRLTAGLEPEGPAERPEDAPDGGLANLGADAAPGETPEPGDPATEAESSEVTSVSRLSTPGSETPGADGEEATASVYSETGERTALSVPPAALRFGEGDLAGPMRELTLSLSSLAGRRWEGGEGPDVDPRQALRESFATGGTVLSVPRRERAESGLRALLLVDVSRSVLDTVDRGFLLRFLHRARSAWRDPRVFFFDDDVREVTAEFDRPTVEGAVDALERAEAEWGGGTRIGHAVRSVTGEGPDAVDRHTVVFVVSDGLEVGDVEDLERGMADLSRTAASVLWCNPLAASPDYEPACRGMAASLPYVDGLFAFSGPADVAEMARQLRLRGPEGTVGYEYDPRRPDAGGTATTAAGPAPAGSTTGGPSGSTDGAANTDTQPEVDNQ